MSTHGNKWGVSEVIADNALLEASEAYFLPNLLLWALYEPAKLHNCFSVYSRESLISELWRGKGSKQCWPASDLASEGKMCQYVGSLRKATHLRRMTYFYWLA